MGSVFKYLLGRRDIGDAYIGSDEGGTRLYEKNDRQSMENAENTLLLMKAFAARMTSENRKTVFLPVPSSGTVYREGLPPFAQVFDAEALLSLAERTLAGSGCVTVDLLPALMERKDAENLYYRTDHHWTAQGAAAAYAPCCGALGKTPLPDEQVRAYEKLSDSFSRHARVQGPAALYQAGYGVQTCGGYVLRDRVDRQRLSGRNAPPGRTVCRGKSGKEG